MSKIKSLIILSLLPLLLSCNSPKDESISQSSTNENSQLSSSESSSQEETSEQASSKDSKEESSEETSEDSSINESSEDASSEETSSEDSQESSGEQKYSLNPEDESLYNNQKYLNYLGDIQEVWDEYRGDDVTIAVIDTGFDIDHDEFKNPDGSSKLSSKSAYLSANETKIGVNNVKITDGNSHGTICATVAAGSITGYGTVGVAPNANLLLLKVEPKAKAINRAFKYAADNGAKVITISLGSYHDHIGDLIDDDSDLSTVFEENLKYAHDKGLVICSAAGNGGLDGRYTEYTFPGASSYVIGAGGLADQSRTSIWSGSSYNYNKEYQFCDVFAPAENLYSGCSWYEGSEHITYGGGFNGTSFASPIIAGAAALYFQKNPDKSNADFEKALFHSSDPFGDTNKTGYGAINIKSLLDYVDDGPEIKDFYFKDAAWWTIDSAHVSAYTWNYAITNENKTFPGQTLESVGNGYWEITVDTSIYEMIIFTRTSPNNDFWGAQTINIHLSDFNNKNCYSIANTSPAWTSDNNYVTGIFINY